MDRYQVHGIPRLITAMMPILVSLRSPFLYTANTQAFESGSSFTTFCKILQKRVRCSEGMPRTISTIACAAALPALDMADA